MVAFASRRRTSAELAAAYGAVASEAAVRADRWGGPIGAAGTQAYRELKALAKAGFAGPGLRRAVNAILGAYVARIRWLVGRSLQREGEWSENALDAIWEPLEPSPVWGGFWESLQDRMGQQRGQQRGLLEARQSKTAKYLEVIKSSDWEDRLERWSKKITQTDPIAETIARGIAHHAKPETIARNILPYVQGYASSAMRIVRTETAFVHNQLAEETFREHRNQIAGFQLLSQLDNRVRPAHATRHGRFYRQGVRRPRLPDAPNCRCYYAPVLKDDAPGFGEWQTQKFDTRTYDSWFKKQSQAVQVRIVGKARYQSVKDRGVRKPQWADFSNLRTGNLLSLETIKRFSPKQFRKRRRKR